MIRDILSRSLKKHFVFFLSFCFAVKLYAQVPQLHIYQFGVGQGDCSLIISRDFDSAGAFVSRSVLIDGGPARSDDKINVLWGFIKDTLTKYTGGSLDCFIISHLHSDHMYGAVPFLQRMLADPLCRNVRILDRFSFSDEYAIDADDCSRNYDMERQGAVIMNYSAFVAANFPNNRVLIRSTQTVFAFRNTVMTCVAANGEINRSPFVQLKGGRMPFSENDLSFAFLLQFNGFNYFTGGDIGGGSPYSDGETPIATTFANTFGGGFHFCAFKVSHHGSTHSTNPFFLAVCRPTLGIIPSALRSFGGTQLPTAETLGALTTAGTNLAYTFNPSVPGVYSSGDAVSYNDINIHLWAPPGVNVPVQMQVQAYVRNRDTWLIQPGTETTAVLTCTKPHSNGPGGVMPPWRWWSRATDKEGQPAVKHGGAAKKGQRKINRKRNINDSK